MDDRQMPIINEDATKMFLVSATFEVSNLR